MYFSEAPFLPLLLLETVIGGTNALLGLGLSSSVLWGAIFGLWFIVLMSDVLFFSSALSRFEQNMLRRLIPQTAGVARLFFSFLLGIAIFIVVQGFILSLFPF